MVKTVMAYVSKDHEWLKADYKPDSHPHVSKRVSASQPRYCTTQTMYCCHGRGVVMAVEQFNYYLVIGRHFIVLIDHLISR